MPALRTLGEAQSYRAGIHGARVARLARGAGKLAGPAERARGPGRLTSRRSAVSCCGVRRGGCRRAGGQEARTGPGRPVDNGGPRWLPAGRTPVRRYGRAPSHGEFFYAALGEVKAFLA